MTYPCPCELHSALADPLAAAIAADPNAAALTTVCRRCGAPSSTWLCVACEPPRDPSADLRTMEMLLHATLEAWKCLDMSTPYDDELAALVRQVERVCAPPPVCRECRGAHQTAACPEIKAEWRRQARLEHAGAGVWRFYRGERARFLTTLGRTSATDTYAMAEALAFYLTGANESGVAVTPARVLECWARECAA